MPVAIICPEHDTPLEVKEYRPFKFFGYCEFCDKHYPLTKELVLKVKEINMDSGFINWVLNQRCWKCNKYVEKEDDSLYCDFFNEEIKTRKTFDDECEGYEYDEESDNGI